MKRRNFIMYSAGLSALSSIPVLGSVPQKITKLANEDLKEVNESTILKVKEGSNPDSAWTKRKVVNLASLRWKKEDSKIELSRFGGSMEKNLGGTGFFRTENVNQSWSMIDPEGYPFIVNGITSVKLADSAVLEVSNILRETGINGIGAWSEHEKFRPLEKPMPYTVYMSFHDSFTDSQPKKDNHGRGWKRRFPNMTISIFNRDFESFVDNMAKEKVSKYKSDPYCIGYYSNIKLPFSFDWPNCPPGLYIVKVDNDVNTISNKIVKN